jgi:[acyl-carrier-protein] S-malonyltransferase
MQEAVPAGAGAMAAILGLDDEKIAAACAEARAAGSTAEVVEPVNYNGPGQTVIAGSKAAVERACAACKARGAKRALLLPVSAPFHSSLMRPAAAKLASPSGRVELCRRTDAGDQQCGCGHRVRTPPGSRTLWFGRRTHRCAGSKRSGKWLAMDITTVAECGPGKVLAGLSKRCAEPLTSIALADRAAIEAAVANLE